jgi:hypothetical protein
MCLYSGDTLSQALEFVPFLSQTMEKASSPGSQAALVTEAVSAAGILVKLPLVDIQAGK